MANHFPSISHLLILGINSTRATRHNNYTRASLETDTKVFGREQLVGGISLQDMIPCWFYGASYRWKKMREPWVEEW